MNLGFVQSGACTDWVAILNKKDAKLPIKIRDRAVKEETRWSEDLKAPSFINFAVTSTPLRSETVIQSGNVSLDIFLQW